MANPHRLPRTVLPRRYALTLTPDLGAATFEGSVDIDVEVAEPTREVVLNAIELEIDEAWVEVGGRAPRRHRHASTRRPSGPPSPSPRTLPPGDAVVSLRFRGLLNDKLRGFYRSTFTDDDGVERVIATTQFEATDARRAFPCWDEPDLKARFAITLVLDDELHAVSNAAIASDEVLDGQRRVRFAETMTMSTYLVAFIVGPLEVTEPVDVAGTPLRLLCPPGKLHLTAFGLEVAEFSLRYLADYFDIPYPGDSMDLVAIPDFAFGAMENLGCVTFRETLLLADPEHATQGELQNVVDVIAHELAHMWFGDLVTMKWWNGIWLNEAFATFMELKVTDAFRPEWERWVSFGLARSTAFDTDALQTTRPIEYPVVSPADAEGMFDVLTYEKGAAVVRMLEQYLGEEEFRAGIRKYMANHQYGNTETTDLWDAIEEATGEPVRRIMDSWIFQGGHPIVSVEVARRRPAAALHPGAVPVPRRRARRHPVGDPAAAPLRASSPARSCAPPRCSMDDVARPRPPGARARGWSPTPTATASTACAPRRRCGRRWWPRPRACSPTSSATASSTTPGRRCSPAPPRVDDFLALADGFGGETDVSVWRRLLAGARPDRPARRGRRRARRSRPGSAPWSAPALERLGWDERPDDADRDRELRGALIGALANLGADPDARARVRGALRALLRRLRRASRPTWPPPWCGPPPPWPAPTRSTRSSSGSRTATRRRRSSGSSTRSPRSATRSRWPGCSSWP